MKTTEEITRSELSIYINAEDIRNLATKCNVSLESIRRIVRGQTMKSKHLGLVIATAKINKEEALLSAQELNNRKKNATV